ncbi:RNA polymerase sigma factor [Caldalkalibacillus salinus]|uniref:RNA polymerase sigma factor n=1 Tax=Caldalkalibacillus salinus TaxID=2803787 RepID=UPI001924B0B1|nr:sigma-70 family RNA polymerase sigma factor [Caldalkalibacillus salinus]
MPDIQHLYRAYHQQLYTFLLYLCGNEHEAEELLQETFYQAIISIHRYKGDAKVSTWLYQVAKHVYLKSLRKKAKWTKTMLEDTHLVSYNHQPEKHVVQQEEQAYLLDVISKLKEPYKQVFILRHFNELSFREISHIFAHSENWARVTFYRAKQKIQAQLKEANRCE